MRALFLLTLVGCEHGQTPFGGDGPGPSDGAMGCLPELLVEGELIDWDSPESAFQGVFGATLTQLGDPNVTVTTAPNGRLSFCATRSDPFVFSVDADSDGHLSGTLTIEPEVVGGSFTPLSLRTIRPIRASKFFGELSLPAFDASAAQVVVLQTGDRSTLTLSGTHDTPQQGDDVGNGMITWSAGATGRYVLFPNVTPASSVMLSGDPLGPRPIPAVAGQLSLVAISFVFE